MFKFIRTNQERCLLQNFWWSVLQTRLRMLHCEFLNIRFSSVSWREKYSAMFIWMVLFRLHDFICGWIRECIRNLNSERFLTLLVRFVIYLEWLCLHIGLSYHTDNQSMIFCFTQVIECSQMNIQNVQVKVLWMFQEIVCILLNLYRQNHFHILNHLISFTHSISHSFRRCMVAKWMICLHVHLTSIVQRHFRLLNLNTSICDFIVQKYLISSQLSQFFRFLIQHLWLLFLVLLLGTYLKINHQSWFLCLKCWNFLSLTNHIADSQYLVAIRSTYYREFSIFSLVLLSVFRLSHKEQFSITIFLLIQVFNVRLSRCCFYQSQVAVWIRTLWLNSQDDWLVSHRVSCCCIHKESTNQFWFLEFSLCVVLFMK